MFSSLITKHINNRQKKLRSRNRPMPLWVKTKRRCAKTKGENLPTQKIIYLFI